MQNAPFLDLTFDGARDVSGTTYWYAGRRSVRAAIKTGSFDPATGALTLEGDAPSLDGEGESHYAIQGRLDGDLLRVRYDCGGLRGSLVFAKIESKS
jgi:hypothetical protein